MKISKKEPSALAARLEQEYELLQRIIERRVIAQKPSLGKGMEERIIRRNLEELER